MTGNFNRPHDRGKHNFKFTYMLREFLTEFTLLVTFRIAGLFTILLTIVITFFVIAAGFWLAYAYLSPWAFKAVLLIVAADVTLGLGLKYVLTNRNR